jgi:hypothetical protein
MSTELKDVSYGALIMFLESVAEHLEPHQVSKMNDILSEYELDYEFAVDHRKVVVYTR